MPKNIQAGQNSFLVPWNPTKESKDFDNDPFISEGDGDFRKDSWRCGTNKSIRKGDRIYIVRTGNEPRGIVASGIARSNSKKCSGGTRMHGVDVDFDVILDSKGHTLTLEKLRATVSKDQTWTNQTTMII